MSSYANIAGINELLENGAPTQNKPTLKKKDDVDRITELLKTIDGTKSKTSSISSKSSSSNSSKSSSSSNSSSSNSLSTKTASSARKSFTIENNVPGKYSKWNMPPIDTAPMSIVPRSEQDHINNVLNDMNGISSGGIIDNIKRDNWRVSTITNIRTLKKSIAEEQGEEHIKLVPDVNFETDDKILKNVYDSLHYINERHSKLTIANTVVDFVGTALGDIFNGEREIMGISPDLTGINEVFLRKISKLEFQTTEVVDSIMQTYGITSGWKIMFELIISIFAQHKMNVLTKAASVPTNNESIKRAYANLDKL